VLDGVLWALYNNFCYAGLAEVADARDLKSCGLRSTINKHSFVAKKTKKGRLFMGVVP